MILDSNTLGVMSCQLAICMCQSTCLVHEHVFHRHCLLETLFDAIQNLYFICDVLQFIQHGFVLWVLECEV